MSVVSSRLAAQLSSIEDELTTSINSSPSQALDSVFSALDEIEASLEGIKGVSLLSIDKAGRRTILVELEQAAMCARRAAMDSGSARSQYIGNTIGHVRRARAVLALAS